MSTSRLGYGLLGPLLVTVGGAAVNLSTPKQRAVMAILLINRNHPVGNASLIDAAWGEEPTPGVRASLHTYVSNLRRLLAGDDDVDPHTVLATAPPGYRLNVADGDCDLDRFTHTKTAGIQAAAAGQFELASSHLAAALSEWRGRVLDDLHDFDFVDSFAAALTEEKILVQTTRIEAEIACGRAKSVISELEALTVEHPYHEPLWAQLMSAYYITERQSDALQTYQRLKSVLADDLGIDPGPTLRELQDRILRQEPLYIRRDAATTAARKLRSTHGGSSVTPPVAGLRDAAGYLHQPLGTITRIGRLSDNDIVLDDADISRRHAIIIDTGSSFVITDLKSANGVHIQGQQLRSSATLEHGDHIRICGREFTFEIHQQ